MFFVLSNNVFLRNQIDGESRRHRRTSDIETTIQSITQLEGKSSSVVHFTSTLDGEPIPASEIERLYANPFEGNPFPENVRRVIAEENVEDNPAFMDTTLKSIDSGDDGLSRFATIGIAVGACLGGLLIIGLVLYIQLKCCGKPKKSKITYLDAYDRQSISSQTEMVQRKPTKRFDSSSVLPFFDIAEEHPPTVRAWAETVPVRPVGRAKKVSVSGWSHPTASESESDSEESIPMTTFYPLRTPSECDEYDV